MSNDQVGRRRLLQLGDGPPTEVLDIPYRIGVEADWSEYLIDDGSVVRIRLVVTDVLRIEGAYDEQGQPQYIVKSQNIVAVSAAAGLCKKPEP